MAKGASKISSGGGAKAGGRANTPSGVDRDGFLQMTDAEKEQFIARVNADPNIAVPAYVDRSITSKVMYSLGMDKKPDVVDDATFDQMKANGDFQFNNDMFRTVYNTGTGITGLDVAQSNLRGDYTQMSGSGGSAHGRAIYFAGGQSGLAESMDYRDSYRGGNVTIRANVKKGAKIVNERDVENSPMYSRYTNAGYNRADAKALTALSMGADGWRQNYGNYHYTMVINRGALAASSSVKNTPRSYTRNTQWSDIGKSSRTKHIV